MKINDEEYAVIGEEGARMVQEELDKEFIEKFLRDVAKEARPKPKMKANPLLAGLMERI